MSITTQRAAVKALLVADTNVGAVHDYERYSNNPTAFFEKNFIRGGKVNGLVMKATQLPDVVLTCEEKSRFIKWTLRWFISAKDSIESARKAEDWLATLTDTFTTNRTLSGTVANSGPSEPEAIITGMVSLGSGEVLVHQLVLHFTSEERVAVTYA